MEAWGQEAQMWQSRDGFSRLLSGFNVEVEAACSATVNPITGRVSMTIPTGTQRITASTAGVRILWPLVDVARRPLLSVNRPGGQLSVNILSGMASGSATGMWVFFGVLNETAITNLANAIGGGMSIKATGASLNSAAWIKNPTYTPNTDTAGMVTRATPNFYFAGASGTVMTVQTVLWNGSTFVRTGARSGGGAMSGQMYGFLGLGLDTAGSAGGTVDVEVSHSLVQIAP